MSKLITVTIEGGKAVVKTEGYTGKACKDATAELQKALGLTESDEPTPEFHQQEAQQVGH